MYQGLEHRTNWLKPPGRAQTVQLYKKSLERICWHHQSAWATVTVCRLPASGWHGGFSAYSGLRGSPTQPEYLESHRLSATAGPTRCVDVSRIWGVLAHLCVCACAFICGHISVPLRERVPTRVCVCALLESTGPPGGCPLSTQGQSVSLLRASPLPSLAGFWAPEGPSPLLDAPGPSGLFPPATRQLSQFP